MMLITEPPSALVQESLNSTPTGHWRNNGRLTSDQPNRFVFVFILACGLFDAVRFNPDCPEKTASKLFPTDDHRIWRRARLKPVVNLAFLGQP